MVILFQITIWNIGIFFFKWPIYLWSHTKINNVEKWDTYIFVYAYSVLVQLFVSRSGQLCEQYHYDFMIIIVSCHTQGHS